jgi:predicted enzyme related to lactoylglutathione lyase
MAEASIGLVLDRADHTQHIDAGATRLEGIGARRVETQQRAEHGMRWVIMADPEGNEFCVCDAGAEASAPSGS